MMRREVLTPIESWAIRSKLRAFGFLLGLALCISSGLTGGAALLARIAAHGLAPEAVASTPK
jgi:hypothetical protein